MLMHAALLLSAECKSQGFVECSITDLGQSTREWSGHIGHPNTSVCEHLQCTLN